MKKMLTITLGLSFVIISNLYASGNHQGDHMHEGIMMNHSNPNGMTNEQMSNNVNNHQGDHMHKGKMTNHSNPNGADEMELNTANGAKYEHN